MKRICYVIPSLSIGGTEKQLIELTRSLVKDHEITIICTHHAGALAGDARRLGAFVRTIELWGGWDFRMRARLRHTFRAHRPDVVHTFMFGFDLAANQAARETGVPVVISSRRQLATWKRPRHVRLQRRANEYVDCIVANSNAVAQFAINQEKANPALFKVIPNGISVDEYRSTTIPDHIRQRHKVPRGKHVIGMVANFSPVKDHSLFLDAAGHLLRRRDDVHFLLVGSGPTRGQVMRAIRKRDWLEHFTIVATLGELADLYALMDVSVLCSKVEGFPNAIMESMAAGVPVVATSVGGIPELVEDGVTGRLVDSRDPADLGAAIDALLESPDQAREMAGRARESISTSLSVERMAEAYRMLYTELLVKSARNGA